MRAAKLLVAPTVVDLDTNYKNAAYASRWNVDRPNARIVEVAITNHGGAPTFLPPLEAISLCADVKVESVQVREPDLHNYCLLWQKKIFLGFGQVKRSFQKEISLVLLCQSRK